METVILISHLIIVVTMVLVILLQRNSNDGLSGLGGGASNPGALGQSRGSSNPLTKATSILATLFVCTSLSLAYLANAKNESVFDDAANEVPEIQEKTQVPFQMDEAEVKKNLGGELDEKVADKVEAKTGEAAAAVEEKASEVPAETPAAEEEKPSVPVAE